LNSTYDSGNFLDKIKEWGFLNPEIDFLVYTDHAQENKPDPDFDFTFIVIVNDSLDFTRDLRWVNYFGKSERPTLATSDESQSIIVSYIQGPNVKFTFFEAKTDVGETTSPPTKKLVNKNS